MKVMCILRGCQSGKKILVVQEGKKYILNECPRCKEVSARLSDNPMLLRRQGDWDI